MKKRFHEKVNYYLQIILLIVLINCNFAPLSVLVKVN